MAECRDTDAHALKMTRARAKAMVMELEYSTKQFQGKLGDILQKEAQQGDVPDELPGRWALAEECHADIFARYGFKSGTGVERLRPIALILEKFPDLEDKVQKLWKLLGLKSSPADLLAKEEVEVSKEPEPAKNAKPILSKARALAFQAELLGAFSAPSFQKKLAELSRKHITNWRETDGKAFLSLISETGLAVDALDQVELEAIMEKAKLEIASRYGYEASQKGLKEPVNASHES